MILLTGGAGYIGSVLTRELLGRGHKVRIFDRYFWGKNHLPKNKNLELVTGDIRSFDAKHLAGVDSIIHLAALSNDPTSEFNPKANLEINYRATERLANLAKKAGVLKFVYASSCSVYYSNDLTKKTNLFTEEDKVSPKAPYSNSKWMSEKALLKMTDKKFSPVILRAGTVHGFSPRMRYDLVVNTMTKDALSKGAIIVMAGGIQWRPIVDISDLCRAYLAVVDAPVDLVGGQIFNILDDNYQVREIATTVARAVDGNTKLEIDEVLNLAKDRSYRASGVKAAKVLKFHAKKKLDASIKDMVKQIKSGEYANFDNPKYYNINWMLTLAEINPEIFNYGPII